MTPIADAVVGPDLPIGIVDLPRPPADFDSETRRRDTIKRDHAIILMAAESVEDRHSGILAPVEGSADIVNRVYFEHEMVEPLRCACLREGERVMARIGMQEDGMNGRSAEFDVNIVTELQAEQAR
jgi:hypothetical protein